MKPKISHHQSPFARLLPPHLGQSLWINQLLASGRGGEEGGLLGYAGSGRHCCSHISPGHM